MNLGLNLYSIRNLIKTEEEFLATAKTLKKLGYEYVQYSGAPFDAERIKRVSEEAELPVVLTHVPMDRIINDVDALMEEHALFGCKNIGLGMMPRTTIANESECKEKIEALNLSAERMAKAGFKFFYHHHHYEFFKYGKETVFAYMMKNAPYINFTLDTYWLQYAGVDVCETVEKLKGRIDCVHLKDYKLNVSDELKFDPMYAPLGDGTLNFEKIIAKMQENSVKYFLVEQDNAADLPDSIGLVTRSIEYSKKNLSGVLK